MIEEFEKYVNNYDLNNIKIKLKYDHSIRVMELSYKYSRKLGFSDYDVKLATLIGLLHDIGRFEQLKQYDSFNDSKTVDHASLGVKILFDDGLIEKFWSNKDDYELIKLAIENHNKFKIENITNERIMKHIKLIRDTDKIDIMHVYGISDELKIRGTLESISDNVLNSINENKQVLSIDIKNENDQISLAFAMAFDINYDECLEEFKTNLNKFYNNLDYKEKLKDIINIVNRYIDERVNKYVRN